MKLNKRLRIHIWIFSLKLILFHEFANVIDTWFCLMFLIHEDWMSYYKKNGSENIFMWFYMIMDFFFVYYIGANENILKFWLCVNLTNYDIFIAPYGVSMMPFLIFNIPSITFWIYNLKYMLFLFIIGCHALSMEKLNIKN